MTELTKISYYLDRATSNLISHKASGEMTQWFRKAEHELLEVVADKLQKYNDMLDDDSFNLSPVPKSMLMYGICKKVCWQEK